MMNQQDRRNASFNRCGEAKKLVSPLLRSRNPRSCLSAAYCSAGASAQTGSRDVGFCGSTLAYQTIESAGACDRRTAVGDVEQAQWLLFFWADTRRSHETTSAGSWECPTQPSVQPMQMWNARSEFVTKLADQRSDNCSPARAGDWRLSSRGSAAWWALFLRKRRSFKLAQATAQLPMAIVCGVLVQSLEQVYNCAAFLYQGGSVWCRSQGKAATLQCVLRSADACARLPGLYAEIDLGPCGQVPFGDLLFDCDFGRVGLEVCEDIWSPDGPMRRHSYQRGGAYRKSVGVSRFALVCSQPVEKWSQRAQRQQRHGRLCRCRPTTD